MLKQAREIDRFLSAPEAHLRGTVIYGPDPGLVSERADALSAKITARPNDPFDVALVEDGDLAAGSERLYGELRAVSMMGGRRLVRLRLGSGSGAIEGAAAEALAQHLQGEFNPDAFLLIEAGELKRGSPLIMAAAHKRCVLIVCYQDSAADLIALIRGQLAKDRLGLDADALERFAARVPPDRFLARQEIERLALFLGPGSGRSATDSDLDAFVGVEPEASLATAAMDAFGGRIGPAFGALRRAEQGGQRGPAAVRALGFHLGRLRRVRILANTGVSPQQALKSTGVFWKNEREFLRQMNVWTRGELERCQGDILIADESCKRSLAPDCMIAERLAVTIATRARRLGL
jgi:DNA polymerase-3 subunit delta